VSAAKLALAISLGKIAEAKYTKDMSKVVATRPIGKIFCKLAIE